LARHLLFAGRLPDDASEIDHSVDEDIVMLGTILLIVLLLLLLGALPVYPHSRNWGYYPSGGLGLVLIILLLLVLFGMI
jgi:hypothetical protein